MRFKGNISRTLLVIVMALAVAAASYALGSYLSAFKSAYPTATYPNVGTINSCLLCHAGYPSASPSMGNLNAYGTDYMNNGYSFSAIESLDSDGDGSTNIAEIGAGSFPGDASSHPSTATAYSVGGSVSGLSGTVVLQNDGSGNLSQSTNGAFTFATTLAGGTAYNVTVLTQPASQTCSVTNGAGTISGANVTNVSVTCAALPPTMYSVGGSVSGLSGTVVLQNNGSGNLSQSTNGAFTFATTLAGGTAYNVTVLTQPASQTCSVTNGAGTISGANVTNVSVTCAALPPTMYSVGGSVSGLGGTVVLQNNGTGNLSQSTNGAFTFATTLAGGTAYNVTVLTQPASQTCSVTNGAGTISGANVTNVSVSCQAVTSCSFLGAGGAAACQTSGVNGAAHAGYAKLAVNSGATPFGTAVFSFKQNGVTVTEAAVPATPPTMAARIFIDYRNGASPVPGKTGSGWVSVNTGIAIVNNGSATANVTYSLRDSNGVYISTGHGTVAAGTHFAKFIDQIKDVAPDFSLPANFQSTIQFGSLEIAGDQPLSVLALRGTSTQRNEFIITTTPTADLTQPLNYDSIYFPQFADGGGYSTSLVLLNTSDTTESGTLRILDDNGLPLTVKRVGGAAGSLFRYLIPSGGVYHFQTDGFPPAINVGSVQLIPDPATPTPMGSGLFSNNPGSVLISESGIPAAVSTTHARIYVDLSANHSTGLAIANVNDVASVVEINAFDEDGATAVGISQGPLQLAGNGHAAKFADQFIAGLPAGFTGVLDISSTTPFAVLTMRSLINEREDFLMTAFPVADANQPAPTPIVFPQIVDGGGYMTQFILISVGPAASTTLNYFDESGAPVNY